MRSRAAVVSVLLALLSSGCAGSAADPAASSSTATSTGGAGASPSAPVTGEVTVLAAASLTRAFTALAETFEQANPGATVRLSFGSSTTLAQQIAQGAPADLFASAGTTALDQLGDVTPARTVTIARNTLEIATPPGNPARVRALADLARPGVDVVLCAETVPCGRAADQVLTKAGVRAHVVSRELDVSATLAKVALDEADAAVVYHSDVVSAQGEVEGVAIPADENTSLEYPLVVLRDAPAAAAFAQLLAGPQGRQVLHDAGFLTP